MAEIDYLLESYKEANQYGRAIHDSHYKLAGISFTFNAILLTGLAFVLKDKPIAMYQFFMPAFIASISVFGVVFNLGALGAFVANWDAWHRLHLLAREFENHPDRIERILKVQGAILPNGDRRDGMVYDLTRCFFGFAILFWVLSGAFLVTLNVSALVCG